MNSKLVHEEIQSLLGVYALNACDKDEAQLVQRHLLECPRCRLEVDQHREVVAAFANSVEPVSDSTWDAIASAIGNDIQLPNAQVPGLDRLLETVRNGEGTTTREAPAKIIPIGKRPLRVFSAMVAVAAMAVIAILGVNIVSSQGQINHLRNVADRTGLAAAIAAARISPDRSTAVLTGAGGVDEANFVLLPDGHGFLVHSNLASLRSGETYQLWAMEDGQPVSLGLLGSHPRQSAISASGIKSGTTLAITAEPAGGVTTPDSVTLAAGTIRQA